MLNGTQKKFQLIWTIFKGWKAPEKLSVPNLAERPQLSFVHITGKTMDFPPFSHAFPAKRPGTPAWLAEYFSNIFPPFSSMWTQLFRDTYLMFTYMNKECAYVCVSLYSPPLLSMFE